MRRIFIGDIQGCSAQLDELLDRLELRGGDRLYSVGDLVNRGPDSLGVLRRMRDRGARAVLGNHDLKLLVAARRRTGVGKALRPVLEAPDADDLLAWLGAQPMLRVEDDLVVVHAGVHPHWSDLTAIATAVNDRVGAHIAGERDERIVFASEVRYCDPDGRLPETDDPPPGPPFRPWDDFYGGERTVVFGHWSARGLVVAERRRGLDTGCVWGGTLSAWIAEEDRVVDVPGWRGRPYE